MERVKGRWEPPSVRITRIQQKWMQHIFYCIHSWGISVPIIWKRISYSLMSQQSIQLPFYMFCVPETLGYPVWLSEGHGALVFLVPYQPALNGCLRYPRSTHMVQRASVQTTFSIQGCLDNRNGVQLGKYRVLLPFQTLRHNSPVFKLPLQEDKSVKVLFHIF